MCECKVANGIRANGAVDSVDMQLTSTPPRAMSGVECVASVSSVKERVWCERAYANTRPAAREGAENTGTTTRSTRCTSPQPHHHSQPQPHSPTNTDTRHAVRGASTGASSPQEPPSSTQQSGSPRARRPTPPANQLVRHAAPPPSPELLDAFHGGCVHNHRGCVSKTRAQSDNVTQYPDLDVEVRRSNHNNPSTKTVTHRPPRKDC